MTRTAADVLADRLIDWGVRVIFGLPGDGINGIMEALRTRQDRITFIQVRHEEGGGVHGVRLREIHRPPRRLPRDLRSRRHSPAQRPLRREDGWRAGPRDHRPDVPRPHRHATISRKSISLSLFKDVAVYNQQMLGRRRTSRALVDAGLPRGARRTGASRTSAVPVDFQEQAAQRRRALGRRTSRATRRTSGARRSSCRCDDDVRAAADVLNAGKKTVILAGQGALGAGDELEQLADLLAAPDRQAAARQGGRAGRFAVHDRRHRPARHRARPRVAMEQCDTLLMVGTSFPVHGVLSRTTTAAAACRSIATRRASACASRSTSACAATRKATLQALLAACSQRRRIARSSSRRRRGMKEWRELMRTRDDRDDMPLKPQVVARHAQRSARRRCDRHDRFGDDHHLGGAATSR